MRAEMPCRNSIRGEGGAAYLWVITITLVVVLLGALFLSMTVTDMKITGSFGDGIRAYYLAESGAEHRLSLLLYGDGSTGGIYDIEKCEDWAAVLPGPPPGTDPESTRIAVENPFAGDSGDYDLPHSYSTTVKREDYSAGPYAVYTITSTGEFNKARRIIEVELKVPFKKVQVQENPPRYEYERLEVEFRKWASLTEED